MDNPICSGQYSIIPALGIRGALVNSDFSCCISQITNGLSKAMVEGIHTPLSAAVELLRYRRVMSLNPPRWRCFRSESLDWDGFDGGEIAADFVTE
jgi:hypothetical protein